MPRKRELSGQKLRQRLKYENGELHSVQDQRTHLCHHTSHLALFLKLHTISFTDTVKRHMDEAGRGLKELELRSMASQHT